MTINKPGNTLDEKIRQLNYSRSHLLIIAIFTAVNLILALTKCDFMLILTLVVPYDLLIEGMYVTGMCKPELYGDMSGLTFFPKWIFAVALIVALLIVGVYVLCWLFSKKKTGWLIAALVLLCIDSLYLVYLTFTQITGESFPVYDLINIVYHVVAILAVVKGIRAADEIKKTEAIIPVEANEVIDGEINEEINYDTEGKE